MEVTILDLQCFQIIILQPLCGGGTFDILNRHRGSSSFISIRYVFIAFLLSYSLVGRITYKFYYSEMSSSFLYSLCSSSSLVEER